MRSMVTKKDKKVKVKKPWTQDRVERTFNRTLYLMLLYIIVGGLSFVILYPYFVKIVTSFMMPVDLLDPTVQFIPRNPTTLIWQWTMSGMDLMVSYSTSFYIAGVTAVIQVLVSALVGYGFARFKFPGRNIIFILTIFTMLVPFTTVMLPYFLMFRFFNLHFVNINLINTIWPNVILSLTGLGLKNGLYIFLFRQYFRGVPRELEEAAHIDGAGHLKTFFLVMLPNAKVCMLTVFLFSFCWQWTDITYATIFFPTHPTVVNASLNVWRGVLHHHEVSLSSLMRNTGTLLVIIPLAVIYLSLQRFFIQGIERSGITS